MQTTQKPIRLMAEFARTSDNHERAALLLDLCNVMLETGIGFADLRRNPSLPEFNKTTAQWNAMVNTFLDKNGIPLMPNPSRTGIVSDESFSLSLHEWGKLFVDVNMGALDKKVAKYRAPEIIKQPNMVYAAFKKLWNALDLKL